MYHPWHRLRELAHVELRWVDRLTDDDLGRCIHRHRMILMSSNQSQAERRCTLAHELVHLDRGPVTAAELDREEEIVERIAARQLIDIRKLGEAIAWSSDPATVAEELWVDEPMLKARLDGLHPAERAYLRDRLVHLSE